MLMSNCLAYRMQVSCQAALVLFSPVPLSLALIQFNLVSYFNVLHLFVPFVNFTIVLFKEIKLSSGV